MSRYTYAQVMARIGLLMQDPETGPNDTPIPKEAWAACLRYFADAAHVAQLLSLTTTPSGQIHVRIAGEGQEIIDLYFEKGTTP